jgi:steroid delta-isomerase-like uncharacterized protein
MKKIAAIDNPSRRIALSSGAVALLAGSSTMAAMAADQRQRTKNFASAEDWVTAFFDKGADVVLGFYADPFVWEDIEFGQTITTREELLKAFTVFNNSGPDSPFGVHKFEMVSYDGGLAPAGSRPETRKAGVPKDWDPGHYERLAKNILLGADFDYDEWGYMQWVWKATHNSDFFGIPAKGQTTYTRGTTTQFYKDGKIVRCRTHWNFREFAMQLGMIPRIGETWRAAPNPKARMKK